MFISCRTWGKHYLELKNISKSPIVKRRRILTPYSCKCSKAFFLWHNFPLTFLRSRYCILSRRDLCEYKVPFKYTWKLLPLVKSRYCILSRRDCCRYKVPSKYTWNVFPFLRSRYCIFSRRDLCGYKVPSKYTSKFLSSLRSGYQWVSYSF